MLGRNDIKAGDLTPELVTDLQNKLKDGGYANGLNFKPGSLDRQTLAALSLARETHKLESQPAAATGQVRGEAQRSQPRSKIDYTKVGDKYSAKLNHLAVSVKIDNFDIGNPEHRKGIQTALKSAGLYNSTIDGIIGEGTIAALDLYEVVAENVDENVDKADLAAKTAEIKDRLSTVIAKRDEIERVYNSLDPEINLSLKYLPPKVQANLTRKIENGRSLYLKPVNQMVDGLGVNPSGEDVREIEEALEGKKDGELAYRKTVVDTLAKNSLYKMKSMFNDGINSIIGDDAVEHIKKKSAAGILRWGFSQLDSSIKDSILRFKKFSNKFN